MRLYFQRYFSCPSLPPDGFASTWRSRHGSGVLVISPSPPVFYTTTKSYHLRPIFCAVTPDPRSLDWRLDGVWGKGRVGCSCGMDGSSYQKVDGDTRLVVSAIQSQMLLFLHIKHREVRVTIVFSICWV
jgi:hypothetical protein